MYFLLILPFYPHVSNDKILKWIKRSVKKKVDKTGSPHRDHMTVYCQKVNSGFYQGDLVKMTWGINSRCFQISICGLKMSISGSLPVKITPDFFSGNFYCTKNSVSKFYEESLTIFQLSRSFPPLSASQVFSQSTAWWFRSCSIRNRSIDNPNQNFRMMYKLVH